MGIAHEPMVGTAVINLYDKFGLTEEAFSAFKTISCIDTIALTAMIACFSHSEQGRNALNLFYSILPQGMQPDKITYVCALDACASISTLDEGKEIHSVVVQVGLERNPIIQTALVNMYGKGFSLCDALWIFWNMPNEDAIPWTVMIGTLAENEEHENALSLFYRMCSNGLNPDEITFICVLDICAGLGMLEEGHTIHSAILEECLDENVVLANNLINMYGKCACLDEARNVFNRMLLRSTITWNTLLGSYALSGQYMDTILLFQDMMNENKVVDDITCLCVLTACSHAGFVEFGMFFFASIYLCHRVIYTKDHYVCAVDLLGRAGHLEEAEVFIHCIPFTYFPMLWLCLLGACKAHGDLARGARSGKWCIALDPTDPAPCIALMNIYSHFDLADLDE
ncbi:hypothetical protein KP509_05G087100 [Ceratopteris richardii]|nr:hypothetical protein KP509_05G087100 [Ceratopteris richardii]